MIHLKDFRKFVMLAFQVSPWLLEQGCFEPGRWKILGEQLTSYDGTCTGKVRLLDYTIYNLVKQILMNQKQGEVRCFPVCTQTGSSLPSPSASRPCSPKLREDLADLPLRPPPGHYPNLGELEDTLRNLVATPPENRGLREQDSKEFPPTKAEIPAQDVRGKFLAKEFLTAPQTLGSGCGHLGAHTTKSSDEESPLQKGIREAKEKGEGVSEWDIGLYPVIEEPDPFNPGQVRRRHESIPFKTLLQLKQAVAQYGPTSPFVMYQLEVISNSILCPNDWKAIARAVLTPGAAVFWMAEFVDQCHMVSYQLASGPQGKALFEQMSGTGDFATTAQQLGYAEEGYHRIAVQARKAWSRIPEKAQAKESMTAARQKATETFVDFVARIQEPVTRTMGEVEGTEIVIKSLLRENCNEDCKKAMLGLPRDATLQEMIRRCEKGIGLLNASREMGTGALREPRILVPWG
ncbi:endogenous retrovirus group K member 21 Gag polyprotein-like [Vombatus ursinus]|uniref:endogenous retrovirus group K member 21 Gag polyprotein-like n=1 Tax=Vombatus ursinus TaxID=29139 RepID=UPI000FFD45DB|nr:endogenous retrovirus group K member 21 Gag polyprotein-like [Vombatus ursinus]